MTTAIPPRTARDDKQPALTESSRAGLVLLVVTVVLTAVTGLLVSGSPVAAAVLAVGVAMVAPLLAAAL
ncbi:hypothetical protein [Rhodococcus yananensis]|uniref:hypothetical protein n=1 Tax=Rhodococcus yananensis TaxID=2879464 RepID=UPI003EBBCB33